MNTGHAIVETRLDQLFQAEIAKLPARPLQQYLQRVLRDCEHVVTVEKVAATMGVTRQHLARLCRNAGLQEGPHWYLSTARLLAAAKLLETSDASVGRVAAKLRFGEASDLYSMFERYAGEKLGDLRRAGIWLYMESLYRQALIPDNKVLRPFAEITSRGSNEVMKSSI